MAFGAHNGLSSDERYKKILFSTNFLSGSTTTLKITEMTTNALDGLLMNINSFTDIMKDHDLSFKVNWSKFSSFYAEKIFIYIRGKISSPSSFELGHEIKSLAAESMRRERDGEIVFRFPKRKVTYTAESNKNGPKMLTKAKLVYRTRSAKKTTKINY